MKPMKPIQITLTKISNGFTVLVVNPNNNPTRETFHCPDLNKAKATMVISANGIVEPVKPPSASTASPQPDTVPTSVTQTP